MVLAKNMESHMQPATELTNYTSTKTEILCLEQPQNDEIYGFGIYHFKTVLEEYDDQCGYTFTTVFFNFQSMTALTITDFDRKTFLTKQKVVESELGLVLIDENINNISDEKYGIKFFGLKSSLYKTLLDFKKIPQVSMKQAFLKQLGCL